MSKIAAMLPTFASVKHELDKPDNWDKMTLTEKKEYFFDNSETVGNMCHQCSNAIELGDTDMNTYYKEKWWDESDFWEE